MRAKDASNGLPDTMQDLPYYSFDLRSHSQSTKCRTTMCAVSLHAMNTAKGGLVLECRAVFRSLPTLDRQTVVVIGVDLAAAPTVESILDDGELRRARRFVFERDYRRFVATRTALRCCLGAWLRVPPRSVAIARAAGGKPMLRDPTAGLQFNLSHAGDYALIAVARSREVGIDIEQVRDVDMATLAQAMFSPRELSALAATAQPYRLQAFYRGWTRKESFLKALGRGLDFPAAQFDVNLVADTPQVLLTCSAVPGERGPWTISTPATPAGYIAAITVQGSDFTTEQLSLRDIRQFRFDIGCEAAEAAFVAEQHDHGNGNAQRALNPTDALRRGDRIPT